MLTATGGLFVLGLLLGAGLELVNRRFPVRKEGKVDRFRALLPGVNCGACGTAGCDALAAVLARGEAGPRACPVGGEELAGKLAVMLGIAPAGEAAAPLLPVVRCRGGRVASPARGIYRGIGDCRAAVGTGGGGTACVHGCLRLGTCWEACPTGALRGGGDGLPVLQAAACTGCGICARVCPRNLIAMHPADKTVQVRCLSPATGAGVRAVCSAGCTGCRRCEKVCPVGAVGMTGFLAAIDDARCRLCGACVEVCPTGAVVRAFGCAAERERAGLSLTNQGGEA